jgi:hypothetical protein
MAGGGGALTRRATCTVDDEPCDSTEPEETDSDGEFRTSPYFGEFFVVLLKESSSFLGGLMLTSHDPGRRTLRVCFAAPTYSDYESGLDRVVSFSEDDDGDNERTRRRRPVQLARILVDLFVGFWLFDACSV